MTTATNEGELLRCPICKGKTRTKAFKETTMTHYPLFCPKCKNEPLVNVKKFEITLLEVPAAVSQSR
jgi:uncharacterized protein YbaR (Trm112 family)